MARHEDKRNGARSSFAAELRNQRVRQTAVLVAVFVLVAVPPVFVNHPIGYIPLIAFVFVLLMSWGYLALITRGFTVEHGFAESSCTRASSVELPVILKNRSRLPILRARPQVYVSNPYGTVEREVLAIAMIDGKGEDRMDVKVQLGHVGVYTAGLRGVVLYDPLMFFSSFANVEEEATLISTPKDSVAGMIEISDMAAHESRTPVRTVLSDNVDYAGTRDYEYGDPMKSVHWKLSARTGSLQTRLFEASVNTKLTVVMDFHAPDYETDELLECNDVIVEMALAVMRLAVRRKVEASLCFVDKHGAAVTTGLPKVGEKERFVSSLPLPSPQVDGRGAIDIAEREVQRFGGSDSIVMCTSSLTRELVACLVDMRGGHRSVSVVVAVPRSLVRAFYQENQAILTELSNAGVVCTAVSDSQDFEWTGGRG